MKMSKFVVLDVVFYANSLNYDQGSGNIKELKKITKWDGKQYTLVSRYALRYSILHHANKLFPEEWKLAGNSELNNDQGVVQAKGDASELIKNFPEFDLFGYMMTESGSAASTRPATAAISHAVSLVPFNYDNHFNANLDMAKRSGKPKSINPFILEEHHTYYVYSIVVDLDRVGVSEGNERKEVLDNPAKAKRIGQLLETIAFLKRQIAGRPEDLSPKLLLVGLYDGKPYQSFKDRIVLADEYGEEITQTEEAVENGTKIVRRTVKTTRPVFEIYGVNEESKLTIEEIKDKIKSFIEQQQKEHGEVLLHQAEEIKVRFKQDD